MSVAPNGTKLWILRMGTTQGDLAWFLRGSNASSVSEPNPTNERRELKMFAMLIEHPDVGLVLYDCGPAPDPAKVWGPDFTDAFPWIEYSDDNRLDNAIAKTGNDIKDVKAVVLSHLHLDHAGGLHHFKDSGVPVYVHEDEMRQAFYAVASKEDYGNYLPDYLTFDQNWQPLSGEKVEIFKGMTLYLTPGHSNGLMGMMLELPDTGPVYFTSDQCVFRESFDEMMPPGWGLRDQDDWYRSMRQARHLCEQMNARVFYGHDPINLVNFKTAPDYYT